MLKKGLSILFILSWLGIFAAADTTSVSGFWHTIKWGETITGIAGYYGINPYLLAGVNNLANWDFILAGDSILIPATGYPQLKKYVVRSGDYLFGIAKKMGVSPWSIAQANGIFNLDLIYPGQTLIIPLQ